MPQFAEMSELKMDPEDELVENPTMEAAIDVWIGLGKRGDLSRAREKPMETRVEAEMTLAAGESTALDARSFNLSIRSRYVLAPG